MELSVIIPTHNPDPQRFARTLAGLAAQTLERARWEVLIVDNASEPPVALPAGLPDTLRTRIVGEPQLGLTHARRRGFDATASPYVVLVDDDNVLAPDYLADVLRLFSAYPHLGALGGRSVPEFATEPPSWVNEFLPLLALRDLGDQPLLAGPHADGQPARDYPRCAPIGAGMALRRAALAAWLQRADDGRPADRRGGELTSGGDNDIVLTLLRSGWDVGYFPSLRLTHLIPPTRLEPGYLARLNEGIQNSWMQVLRRHDINRWPPIAGWTYLPRVLKAWFTYRAWSGTPARIRWHGARGHFRGRIAASS